MDSDCICLDRNDWPGLWYNHSKRYHIYTRHIAGRNNTLPKVRSFSVTPACQLSVAGAIGGARLLDRSEAALRLPRAAQMRRVQCGHAPLLEHTIMVTNAGQLVTMAFVLAGCVISLRLLCAILAVPLGTLPAVEA